MTSYYSAKRVVLATLAAGVVAACAPQDEQPSAGGALYAANCAVCHGATGRGEGPAAAALASPLPDLTTLTARNGGVFPLVAVMAKIDGYTRGEGTGSTLMPEFGAGFSEERVLFDTGDGIATPTPVELVGLAEYLQGIQR